MSENAAQHSVWNTATSTAPAQPAHHGLGIGGGTNSAVIGNDIRGMVIGIQLFGALRSRTTISTLADTSSNPDARHFDGITFSGGQDGSVIEHNTISMPTRDGGTAAVFIKTEFGRYRWCSWSEIT